MRPPQGNFEVGDRKGTWKEAEGQGQPCTPQCARMESTYEWKWKEGEQCVWEATRSPGTGWGDDRQIQGTPASSGTAVLLVTSSQVKAWQRRGDETEQVEGRT